MRTLGSASVAVSSANSGTMFLRLKPLIAVAPSKAEKAGGAR